MPSMATWAILFHWLFSMIFNTSGKSSAVHCWRKIGNKLQCDRLLTGIFFQSHKSRGQLQLSVWKSCQLHWGLLLIGFHLALPANGLAAWHLYSRSIKARHCLCTALSAFQIDKIFWAASQWLKCRSALPHVVIKEKKAPLMTDPPPVSSFHLEIWVWLNAIPRAAMR